MHLTEEEVPSFQLKFSFQSNMAFMIAVFILSCALAWAIRDHRRRLIEISSEEQEDRLYLVVLAVLFLVCIMGSYYAFNKTKLDSQGRVVSSNALVDELWNSYRSFRENMDTQARSWPPYQPNLPVQMPIPGSHLLDKAIHHKDDPDTHYHLMAWAVFTLMVLFSLWYFYPRQTPTTISPPKSFKSGRSTRGGGGGGVGGGGTDPASGPTESPAVSAALAPTAPTTATASRTVPTRGGASGDKGIASSKGSLPRKPTSPVRSNLRSPRKLMMSPKSLPKAKSSAKKILPKHKGSI